MKYLIVDADGDFAFESLIEDLKVAEREAQDLANGLELDTVIMAVNDAEVSRFSPKEEEEEEDDDI